MKSNKMIKYILLLFVFFYIMVYVISNSSYYEYKLQERTILTSEQIKLFENDVNMGKDVSLYDYVVNTNVDYSTSFTDYIYKLGININKYFKSFIELCLKILGSLVSD